MYTIQLLEEHEKDILTINNPMHRRVEDVVTRILKSNEDIKAVSERDWKISVVDDYTVNAMVIPVRNSSSYKSKCIIICIHFKPN